MRGPLGSDRRREIGRKLERDLELLDTYYEGDEPAYKILKRLVKHGRALLEDATLRSIKFGAVTQAVTGALDVGQPGDGNPQRRQATTREDVVQEVTGDLMILQTYLVDVVFGAAGIWAYLSQELKGLRNEFARSEPTWNGVALK